MKIKFAIATLALSVVAGSGSAFPVYFLDNFNLNPVLGATPAPGAWYVDRYAPLAFDSQSFGGDNRLRIGISAADGAASRPPAYSSTFYNTQGRSFDLDNGTYTSIKGKLYVAADWTTQLRRSDIWGVLRDSGNNITHYPILGFANVSLTSPALVCRVYSQDTDQNPGNGYAPGWVNVTTAVPGGATASRWYDLEIRLKPGAVEFFVDGTLVFADGATFDSVRFSAMIMQGYNFNDVALGPGVYPPGLNDSYDVYWDDVGAVPGPAFGLPVDLNGSYRSASSGPVHPSPSSTADRSQLGVAFASTASTPGLGFCWERSGTNSLLPAENIVNGTFTPFNDSNKVPNTTIVPTANGTSYEADLDLSGTWKPYQWGAGIGNSPPFATGDTFNIGYNNSNNQFGVQIVTDYATGLYSARIASIQLPGGAVATLESNGSPYLFPAGTSKVRVKGAVSGGFFSASVIPLDGPAAFGEFPLGSTDGTDMDTNAPWTLDVSTCAFSASFLTHEHENAKAACSVSNFTTSAFSNALYAFADDPYVRTADPFINYRVGQANLLQIISGYQAFMFGASGQTFSSGTYYGPYTTFVPPTIGLIPSTSFFDIAGATAFDNQANLNVAGIQYVPGGEGVTGIGFRANSGTSVNLFSGGAPSYGDIPATTVGSNQVIVDNTAPTLGTPVLSGSSWVAPNVVQGNLMFTVNAVDSGTHRSGLDSRPSGQVTWSNLSTTPVVMYSAAANDFKAVIPITSSTPNGTATLVLNVCDRAGNCSTTSVSFNVSTVNLLMTIAERGVYPTATSRVVEFKFGGSLGSGTAPISVRRVVNFSTPTDLLDGLGNPGTDGTNDSLQGTTLFTYQDLDLADDNVANNSVPSGAALTLFRAKDPFFSLAKQEPLSGTAGNFSGSVILRMGDVTNNNIVNVSDLAVWAANNGSATSPNTTLIQTALPRQANINGTGSVNLFDRNLITSSWLIAGDSDGVGLFTGRRTDGSLPVRDVIQETGLNPRLIVTMDIDGNGILTAKEVLKWVK